MAILKSLEATSWLTGGYPRVSCNAKSRNEAIPEKKKAIPEKNVATPECKKKRLGLIVITPEKNEATPEKNEPFSKLFYLVF